MKSVMKSTATALAVLAMLTACAEHPDKIPAQYVSPLEYQSYSCRQMEAEMHRLSARVSELGAQNEDAASNSDATMGVGLVLFWPALFFLDKNTSQAMEYGRLKGEFEALEKASIQKDCHFHVERPKVERAKPATKEEDSMAPHASKR